jgi:hypothetical protein
MTMDGDRVLVNVKVGEEGTPLPSSTSIPVATVTHSRGALFGIGTSTIMERFDRAAGMISVSRMVNEVFVWYGIGRK